MGLPVIEITFKQLAATLIQRSARGIVALIIKDDTDNTFTKLEYKNITEIVANKYTAANVQYIKDCFVGNPAKVIVLRIDTTGNISDALDIAASLKFNWIGIAGGTAQEQTDLVTWIESMETQLKTYKAIVYNAANPDSKHIVNFVNSKVTFADSRGEVTGDKYIPSLLGLFAGLGLDRSATYLTCSNLTSVVEPTDINNVIDAGKLVLINDELVKIGSGVNSLVTVTANNTADMKHVAIVEAMDLIQDDIRNTFKNEYVGRYKNKLEYQILFISAVNSYFRNIANEDVLDSNYNNVANINVEAQRAAWIAAGKPEAESWDDKTVKNTTFKNKLFLGGDIKILDAMEGMEFIITLF